MPRWPDEPVPTGRLDEPRFVRNGFDPTRVLRPRPPHTASPWARHIELARQNPALWNPTTQEYDGGWMLVSEIKKGGPRARQRAIKNDKSYIMRYVERYWPLERWQTRILTVPETWCDKQLYIRFLGTWTPEEAELERKQRSEKYQRDQLKAVENRRKRAQAAREKAAREELEARVKIRGRRRPGR